MSTEIVPLDTIGDIVVGTSGEEVKPSSSTDMALRVSESST